MLLVVAGKRATCRGLSTRRPPHACIHPPLALAPDCANPNRVVPAPGRPRTLPLCCSLRRRPGPPRLASLAGQHVTCRAALHKRVHKGATRRAAAGRRPSGRRCPSANRLLACMQSLGDGERQGTAGLRTALYKRACAVRRQRQYIVHTSHAHGAPRGAAREGRGARGERGGAARTGGQSETQQGRKQGSKGAREGGKAGSASGWIQTTRQMEDGVQNYRVGDSERA